MMFILYLFFPSPQESRMTNFPCQTCLEQTSFFLKVSSEIILYSCLLMYPLKGSGTTCSLYFPSRGLCIPDRWVPALDRIQAVDNQPFAET